MKHGCSYEREGFRMERSTESLTATSQQKEQSRISNSHHYASCFWKQALIRLLKNI